MSPPANDCYIDFSCEDYPIELEDGDSEEDKEYVEDYNLVCEYLKSLNLPYDTFIVDITW